MNFPSQAVLALTAKPTYNPPPVPELLQMVFLLSLFQPYSFLKKQIQNVHFWRKKNREPEKYLEKLEYLRSLKKYLKSTLRIFDWIQLAKCRNNENNSRFV